MITIRPARSDDAGRVVQLRRDAARWLESVGSDQWSSAGLDEAEFRQRVEHSISAGETWVATDDQGSVLGTIAADTHTNPGLWTDRELAEALVVHRMIRDADAPSGTGSALLNHVAEVARQQGKRFLRLDAWTTNAALHRYYATQGFRHVRTVANHHTSSAALFERPIDTPQDRLDQDGGEVRKTP